MSKVVSLREVAEQMDLPDPDWTVYLHRKTGELVLVTGDDVRALESMEEGDSQVPRWQAENLPKVREALSSEDYLALPGKDEFDEYRLMQRFASAIEDVKVSEKLLRAIQGRGAFRYFKDTAREHGMLDAWFECRDRALEELAAEWLEANGIEFTRD